MLRSSSRRVDVPIVADEETDLRGDLEGVLRDLSRRAPGVLGAVIADESGLTVAGNGGHREQVDVLAAMATLIARSADNVFETLNLPGPPVVLLEGPVSGVAVMRLGASEMNLLCFFSKSANIGLVKIEMRHVGARLAEMLGLGVSPSSGIEELFVMTRGGVLLRHYSSTLRTDIDRDILSGMLVAVQEFVKQTLAMKQGGLDELRYGAYTILFVRGTETVAAAVPDHGRAARLRIAVRARAGFLERRHLRFPGDRRLFLEGPAHVNRRSRGPGDPRDFHADIDPRHFGRLDILLPKEGDELAEMVSLFERDLHQRVP